MTHISTPVNIHRQHQMLCMSGYDDEKTKFLVKGFSQGFDIGYTGPMKRQDTSHNLPFKDGVGDHLEMWRKVMKEVKESRFAGPFRVIPFRYYVQSPIGLVPKANGQTRLIFHLSFDFQEFKSINHYILDEVCSVKYQDLDHAVKNCLKIIQQNPECCLWLGISDLQSAFRTVPTMRHYWHLMMLKAQNPSTGQVMYFCDKNLAFGSSISCALYQKFSDALAHVFEFAMAGRLLKYWRTTNYLNDFLFFNTDENHCNEMVREFANM